MKNLLRKILAWVQKILSWRFFARREEVVGTWNIIKWWEVRRIPYNLIVGATGVFTCLALIGVTVIGTLIFEKAWGEQPSLLPDSPIFAMLFYGFAVMAYGVAANVCFACGWIVEIFVRKVWRERAGAFGEISFALGLVFSILLTLVPIVLYTGLLLLGLLVKLLE